nr:XVIPCD domain-containing protein [Dyella sp. ASV24]
MADAQKYTLTVYIAAPGTPLLEEHPGDKSTPGHMFYVVNDGVKGPRSYGFAPVDHGSIDGQGFTPRNDLQNYKDPLYSRTMEISKEQYDKLTAFGDDPKQHGFDMQYKDVRNNCVDFTWAALNHAGIQHQNHVDLSPAGGRIPLPGTSEGKSALRPTQNIDDVKSIKDPVPGSPLNKEHTNPMPSRDFKQWLLSDIPLDDPSHPGNAMYKQAHEGVAKLNAQHQVPASDRDMDFAASIATNAKAGGLDRIDHVMLSPEGDKVFAVQGNVNSLHGMDRQMVSMQTVEALNTPLAQSSANWQQAAEQGQQVQQQAQARQENQAQQVSQQQGPVMRA